MVIYEGCNREIMGEVDFIDSNMFY